MWDLSSPTRDRTRTPCIGRWSLNHWTTREVPWAFYVFRIVIHNLFYLFQNIFSNYHLAFFLTRTDVSNFSYKSVNLFLSFLSIILKKKVPTLVQHGRVEGRVITPSCESTRITTNCWTVINRKTLEIIKKDTPRPKTKEKPQWDGRRGAITIKSNPITTGWVTHELENNYITEVQQL